MEDIFSDPIEDSFRGTEEIDGVDEQGMLQRKEAISPSIDLTNYCGFTSQLRKGAGCYRRTCDISNELHRSIRAYIKREIGLLFEQR